MLHLIMVISTLVMTAVPVFGEFIQKTLQDSGPYSVTLVNDQEELFGLVQTGEVKVVILDMELETKPVALINQLKGIDEQLTIILFNDKWGVATKYFQESETLISYEGVLRTSELKKVLGALLIEQENKELDSIKSESVRIFSPSKIIEERESTLPRQAPDWLSEVNDLARILARLTLESAAHAALITKNNQLWSYAGHLSKPAAEELAQSLWNSWDRGGGNDLAQFIILEATHLEYILYATGLGGDYVLGLAFEAAIPFSEMRMQASLLAKKLTTPLGEPSSLPEEVSKMTFDPEKRGIFHGKSSSYSPERKEDIEPLENDIAEIHKDGESEDVKVEGEMPVEIGREEIYKKEPDNKNAGSNVFADKDTIKGQISDAEKKADNLLSGDEEIEEEITNTPVSSEEDLGIGGPRLDQEEKVKSRVSRLSGWDELVDFLSEADDSERTLESPTTSTRASNHLGRGLDEVSERVTFVRDENELVYHCVLLPRFPYHYLVGDLAKRLEKWLRRHSVAFGWRLEKLVINRDYFHWVASLSAESAPGKMIRNLREESSKYIFNEFPRFERENPSGDFWAPGCLIINGGTEYFDQFIDHYLIKIRERQGIRKELWDREKDK